jgi:hypothetical protein
MGGDMRSTDTRHDESLFTRLADVFITEDMVEDTERGFRARVIIVFSIAVSIWGPIYALVLYALDRSIPAVVTLLAATVLIGGSPVLMRKGVSHKFLGHWITLNTFLIVNAVALLGFGSESLWWQSIVVVVAVLLCSVKAGVVWMILSAASLLVYFQLVANGTVSTNPFSGRTETLWDFSVMTGLYVVVGLLTFAYEWLKQWALGTIRSREAKTRAILGTAPDGIITVESDGKIDEVNRAAEEIFGFESGQTLEGVPIQTLVPGIEDFQTSIQALSEGDLRHETQGRRRDGSRFPLEVSARPIEDGQQWVLVVRDITDRKRVERQLEEARDEAVRANRSKSAFLANMSHELRTPLNAVIGYSELVGEELEDMGHDEVLPDIERINVAGEHLLSLINDVLDLSKIEAGRMDVYLETVELPPLLEDIVSTARPLVEENGNRFKVDVEDAPERVDVDRTKLRQMLLNLLSNAAKFTEDAIVRLHVFTERDDGVDWYVAEVIDRGIGIGDDELDELFDSFTQADESTTRDYGGTGLGLAITRRFAEMMGGTITVESTLGEGSTFRIKLPVAPSDAADQSGSGEPNHAEVAE